jgi:hypothetical protein
MSGLGIGFIVANVDGVAVFEFGSGVKDARGALRPISRGERIQIRSTLENPLAEGRYFVHCGVSLAPTARVLSYIHNAIDFMVLGGAVKHGVVCLEHSIEAQIEAQGR